MMSFRRMLPFLLLNILVSAAVVLGVLWWWDGRETDLEPTIAELSEPVQQAALPQAGLSEAGANSPAPVEEPGTQASTEEGPEVHVVQAGDTLGQISLKYNVSIEAIMAANGMDNPNFLAVGQELSIPAPGAELPAPDQEDEADQEEDSAASGSLPTPIPTEPAVEGEALLEIANVSGVGQLNLETIQIVNNGSRETSLREWKITDQLGNTYTFGQLTLFGDGAGITLHTSAGQDTATDLFWGLDEAIWKSGDRIVLYDDSGTVQAEFQVP